MSLARVHQQADSHTFVETADNYVAAGGVAAIDVVCSLNLRGSPSLQQWMMRETHGSCLGSRTVGESKSQSLSESASTIVMSFSAGELVRGEIPQLRPKTMHGLTSHLDSLLAKVPSLDAVWPAQIVNVPFDRGLLMKVVGCKAQPMKREKMLAQTGGQIHRVVETQSAQPMLFPV